MRSARTWCASSGRARRAARPGGGAITVWRRRGGALGARVAGVELVGSPALSWSRSRSAAGGGASCSRWRARRRRRPGQVARKHRGAAGRARRRRRPGRVARTHRGAAGRTHASRWRPGVNRGDQARRGPRDRRSRWRPQRHARGLQLTSALWPGVSGCAQCQVSRSRRCSASFTAGPGADSIAVSR